ncbi:MAG: hypothetical protein ACC662_01960, partial [Planctomycetota bacterium]
MIVTDVRDRPFEGVRELSASVTFEGAPPETRRIWLRRPDPGEAGPGVADPLLAALLISAMALGEDLVIEAPVTASLVDGATTRVVPQLLEWHERLRPSAVTCDRVADGGPPGASAGTGCLFSSGVDSWHSFLRRRREIAALVHIRGFEIRHDHEALWRQVHGHVRDVAREHGKDLIGVHTNFLDVALQAVTDRLARAGRAWRSLGTDAWYGSMLVAVGLALRPRLDRLIVPASWSHHVDYPVASHPSMEPAWSTPSMAFEIDGFDTIRIDKVRELVDRAPDVIPRIRVCIDTSGRVGERLNCGRCVKCMRLWMELRVCGASGVEGLFSRRVTLRRAKR